MASSSDRTRVLMIVIVVAAVTLIASYVPARRAASVDPNVVMRE